MEKLKLNLKKLSSLIFRAISRQRAAVRAQLETSEIREKRG
jgi:hypothetical protein